MLEAQRPTGGRWYAGSQNVASGRKMRADETMQQPIHGKAVWTCTVCGKQIGDPHRALHRYPLKMTCICRECDNERKLREAQEKKARTENRRKK